MWAKIREDCEILCGLARGASRVRPQHYAGRALLPAYFTAQTKNTLIRVHKSCVYDTRLTVRQEPGVARTYIDVGLLRAEWGDCYKPRPE
jgi:hypothetical protein